MGSLRWGRPAATLRRCKVMGAGKGATHMNDSRMPDVARYWVGLTILERLDGAAPGLTSEEVRAILGARSVRGIGAALSGTLLSLGQEGIRLHEALDAARCAGEVSGARGRGSARRATRSSTCGGCGHGANAGIGNRSTRRRPDIRVRYSRCERSHREGRCTRSTAGLPGSTRSSTTSGSRPRPTDPGQSGRSSSTELNRGSTGRRARCPRATARTGSGCAGATTTRTRG